MVANSFKRKWLDNQQWWFAGTKYDSYLTHTFIHHLDYLDDHVDPVEYILLCDQLARHTFRHDAHIIAYYLNKAVHKANQLTDAFLQGLSDQEWCFAMMPLRHKYDIHDYLTIMHEGWKRFSNHQDPFLKSFLKATYQRCPMDQIAFLHKYSYVALMSVRQYTKDATTIEQPTTALSACNSTLKSIRRPKLIILSLSGGVDSMVASCILAEKRSDHRVVAVHINYMNKPFCLEEEAMIISWCAKLGITLYVRQIVEIQRKPCMEHDLRETYESYTRRVRYNTYKAVAALNMCTADDYVVVLGHNRDDCFENIMTNIINGKISNLKGMTVLGKQDDIYFFRPMLDVTKHDIRQYAIYNSVPHLPDSTPAWAQRGKIRDKIVPALQSWDSRFIPAAFELSSNVTDMYSALETTARDFASQFKTNTCVMLSSEQVLELKVSVLFWKIVFQELSLGHISISSLNHFTTRLAKWKVAMNKHLSVVLNKTATLHLQQVSENTTTSTQSKLFKLYFIYSGQSLTPHQF